MRVKWLLNLFLGLLVPFLLITCGEGLTDDNSSDDSTVNSADFAYTVSGAIDANDNDHGDSEDYEWYSSDVIQITLNGTSITENTSGATADGSTLTITAAGTYALTGTLSNGQIVINAGDDDLVRLILNGVNITNSSNAPIYIANADKAIIVLAESTTNYITDGTSYSSGSEANAPIYSLGDLSFYGDGALIVDGNYEDGIVSKDGLVVKSGNITVTAVDDGIRGKDYYVMKGGNVSITCGGDGIKSDNEDDPTRGYIYLKEGTLSITATGDGISAQTDALVSDGDITIVSGGGSSKTVSNSAKGIKAGVNVIIDGGTFSINSADDAVHSDGNLVVNGGTFTISTGDDAFHGESSLQMNGGTVTIAKSYEGLESQAITINGGTIHLNSSDDGIGGSGGTTVNTQFGAATSGTCYINGGYVYVNSTGDGLDINGSITMTGGEVIVNGPTNNANGPIDYDGTFKVSGGTLLAVGSSGMPQAPGSSSSQCSIMLRFSSAKSAGTIVCLQDSDGNALFTFKPTKTYQMVVFSSSQITKGSTYSVYLGGSSSATATDGLYADGTYSGGTLYSSFTVSSVVTSLTIR
jgi:hypothetical protein